MTGLTSTATAQSTGQYAQVNGLNMYYEVQGDGFPLVAIKASALVISGNQDVCTLDHALEMSRLLQHAQLAIFPGGHGDYIGEINKCPLKI
ncbi:hypothetical protein HB364_26545 [Pseudoflavitalea sp. X16]|uniref:alpha/beta fold hydrolase n=1 Tax=Paraflavitalea devenefica TaxID=2716334 RepID=UPI00141F76E6|nr:hypothetical protein [Paraflavitalea devenefica]NII28671.1 hypothetical protein [Paraflavitalea devenefica]